MESILTILLKYRYWAIFPVAAIEGPFVALVVGFLVYLGYISVLPAYLLLILGDLIPDSIYYYIGLTGNKAKLVYKYFSRFTLINKNFKLVEHLWEKHPAKTMFFSKLAYGMSAAFLISAGLVKMSYKKFIAYVFPITLFHYAILMFVGYSLGHSYLLAGKYLKYGYIILGFVIVFIGIIYFAMTRYAEKKMIEMEKEENQ